MNFASPTHEPTFSRLRITCDQIEVMRHFGFAEFDVLAHDRGARVARRLALDHQKAVNVQGKALPCGHYIPEEAPELLLDQVKLFLN